MSNDSAAERAPPRDEVSESFDRSIEYRIRRAPDLMTVTPGARVMYTCDHAFAKIGATGSREGVRWYKFRARALLEETRGKDPKWAVPIEKGPVGEYQWNCQWDEPPGRYVVGAELSDGRRSTFCFLPQYVESAGLVVGGSLESLLKGGVGPSAAEAESAVARHLANLEAIEKRFPIAGASDKRAHDTTVQNWKKAQASFRKLLAPTDGKTRIAIRAMHLETTTQLQRPLLLFLCYVGDDVVGRSSRKRPRWMLVDWTDPTDLRFHGTYEGDGDTHEEAIRGALTDWDWGNCYPEGLVTYELPAKEFGQAHRREMPTNGKNLGDEVKSVFEWIAVGGLLVAGALLLFTPVPALAAGALGGSLLSSTAAATISIGQRWRAGIFDWREDAFDGLTIISNLFAGAGAWRLGARVLLKGKSGETVTRVFIGAQIGADLVQGVLVAEQALREWTELTEDPALLPEERSRRLLALFRGLAVSGLLTYVSLRASNKDLEALNEKPRHVPNEGQARATGEKFGDLTNRAKVVTAYSSKKVEGDTAEVIQAAKVSAPEAPHPKKLSPAETEFAREFPKDDSKWSTRYLLQNEIEMVDCDGFTFKAELKEDVLTFAVFKKDVKTKRESKHIWPKKMFRLTYQYFEKELGKPIRRVAGEWMQDNFDAAILKYDELIAGGMTEAAAAQIAVKHSLTYKYHEEQGFSEVLLARPHKKWSTFQFEFERPTGGK